MLIEIKFYSSFRELMGTSWTSMEMAEGTTLGDLVDIIRDRHPRLRLQTDEIVVSLNRNSLPPETVLKDGDVVSFLPPLTGG